MRLLFLAPLLTGLISVYISYQSQDELSYLTGTVAGVSMLISLMIAPWQVQLLLLVLVLSTIRYIWKNTQTENTSEIQQLQSTIKTKFNLMRGQQPAAEITEQKKVRKYRGALIDDTPSQRAATPSNLKYRGANVNRSKTEP